MTNYHVHPCTHCWKKSTCTKKLDITKTLELAKPALAKNKIFITRVNIRCADIREGFKSRDIIYDKVHSDFAIITKTVGNKAYVKYSKPYYIRDESYTGATLYLDKISLVITESRERLYSEEVKISEELPNDIVIETLEGIYEIWMNSAVGSPTFNYRRHMKSVNPEFNFDLYYKNDHDVNIEEHWDE